MLDRLVAEIGLDGPGIDAVVSQLEAAGVAHHVRVDLHIEAYSLTSALDHRLKATLSEWRTAFRCEHERRFGFLFTLKPPQGAQFLAGQWVRGKTAILESTDVQERTFEVDLIPTKVDQLRCTNTIWNNIAKNTLKGDDLAKFLKHLDKDD